VRWSPARGVVNPSDESSCDLHGYGYRGRGEMAPLGHGASAADFCNFYQIFLGFFPLVFFQVTQPGYGVTVFTSGQAKKRERWALRLRGEAQ